MLFAEELMTGYSRPHYSIPIDKRSALVLSDINDLVSILRRLQGFPKITAYHNSN